MPTSKFVLLCCVGLICLAGCGKKEPSSVSGNVTYMGATVENGSLRFYPTTKESGRGATAAIKGGVFEIPLGKGLLPGPYFVSVNAQQMSGAAAASIPKLSGPGTDNPLDQTEFIPLEYNVNTRFEIVLEPGANDKDISLPAKKK